jgi:hypothetical protein
MKEANEQIRNRISEIKAQAANLRAAKFAWQSGSY